ncbi:hypothetical protein [Mycoplana rhizolycopersici]|uniref:Uncharacterized protein n=1 Tax=Mycoplana rhizolycopersici TaxID=2746702 RepID=A0ABX2QDM2_9HYPH|nr:hypothetical protein [Rhizobium rhizolycopersici]NVP54466.1 hypothetical protein [Rhizobium rhizolycopersici]
MSKLTRATLARSVLAAVRGKMEDERPEDIEDDEQVSDDERNEDASDEERDPDAEEEKPDEDAEDEAPSEEDEQSEGRSASAIRRAEQGRIHAILTHPKADTNPGLAAELAFGKRHYSAKEAGALLSSSAANGRLAGKMKGRVPALGAGDAGGGSSPRQHLTASVGNFINGLHGRNRKGA